MQIDLTAGQVTVKYDEGKITAHDIKVAITTSGYDVVS